MFNIGRKLLGGLSRFGKKIAGGVSTIGKVAGYVGTGIRAVSPFLTAIPFVGPVAAGAAGVAGSVIGGVGAGLNIGGNLLKKL